MKVVLALYFWLVFPTSKLFAMSIVDHYWSVQPRTGIEPQALLRIDLDIDKDGEREVFLSDETAWGKSGFGWEVYRVAKEHTCHLGKVNLVPDSYFYDAGRRTLTVVQSGDGNSRPATLEYRVENDALVLVNRLEWKDAESEEVQFRARAAEYRGAPEWPGLARRVQGPSGGDEGWNWSLEGKGPGVGLRSVEVDQTQPLGSQNDSGLILPCSILRALERRDESPLEHYWRTDMGRLAAEKDSWHFLRLDLDLDGDSIPELLLADDREQKYSTRFKWRVYSQVGARRCYAGQVELQLDRLRFDAASKQLRAVFLDNAARARAQVFALVDGKLRMLTEIRWDLSTSAHEYERELEAIATFKRGQGAMRVLRASARDLLPIREDVPERWSTDGGETIAGLSRVAPALASTAPGRAHFVIRPCRDLIQASPRSTPEDE